MSAVRHVVPVIEFVVSKAFLKSGCPLYYLPISSLALVLLDLQEAYFVTTAISS